MKRAGVQRENLANEGVGMRRALERMAHERTLAQQRQGNVRR